MTNMVRARVTVKVVTGEVFRTGWSKESSQSLKNIQYLMSRVSDMEKFDITTARGRKILVNPAHIVYSYVETK